MKKVQQQKKNKPGRVISSPEIKKEQALNRLLFFLCGLITFISLFPVIFNDFINFDDPQYVYSNPVIQKFTAENIYAVFTGTYVGNYQPLTMLCYMFIHSLSGLSPGGYHFFSLFFHTLNALLVYLIFFRLVKWNTASFITALLFGIHPMHVESVAWVSALKDIMYTFFFFAALYFYIHHAKEHRQIHLFLSLLFFMCSVLCKAQAVVLPVTFFLTDYLMGRKLSRKTIFEKIPFFGISLAFGILAIYIQKTSGAVQDWGYFPVWQRILFACYGLVNYSYKILIPLNLSIFYPYPETNDQINSNWVYAAPAILIATGILLWKFMKRSKAAYFGVLFFLFTIALVLQLIPVGDAIIADRYTYLPAAGIFFIAGYHLELLMEKNKNRKAIILACAGILLFFLSGLSFHRSTLWKDSISIYSDALKKHRAPIVLNNRGVAYDQAGQTQEALRDFSEVVAIKPRYPNGYKNLAFVYQKLNDHEKAIGGFTEAARYYPRDEMIYFGRAKSYKMMGKIQEALADINKVIEKNPKHLEAVFLRAEIYGQTGALDQSLQDLNTVLMLKPDFAEAYANIGIVKSMKGDMQGALDNYSKAISMNPRLNNVYMNRSLAYKAFGKYNEALEDAITARKNGVQVSETYIEELKTLGAK